MIALQSKLNDHVVMTSFRVARRRSCITSARFAHGRGLFFEVIFYRCLLRSGGLDLAASLQPFDGSESSGVLQCNNHNLSAKCRPILLACCEQYDGLWSPIGLPTGYCHIRLFDATLFSIAGLQSFRNRSCSQKADMIQFLCGLTNSRIDAEAEPQRLTIQYNSDDGESLTKCAWMPLR
jgi:hypothetical protein